MKSLKGFLYLAFLAMAFLTVSQAQGQGISGGIRLSPCISIAENDGGLCSVSTYVQGKTVGLYFGAKPRYGNFFEEFEFYLYKSLPTDFKLGRLDLNLQAWPGISVGRTTGKRGSGGSQTFVAIQADIVMGFRITD